MSDNDYAARLRDSIRDLDAFRKQQELLKSDIEKLEYAIHTLAIDNLKLVEKPKKWTGSQFRCAGKVVQLTISDSTFESRHVQLYEIGSLPEVAD